MDTEVLVPGGTMTKDKIKQLIRERDLRGDGDAKIPFNPELRNNIVLWVRNQQQLGYTVCSACADLGVSEFLYYRWSKQEKVRAYTPERESSRTDDSPNLGTETAKTESLLTLSFSKPGLDNCMVAGTPETIIEFLRRYK